MNRHSTFNCSKVQLVENPGNIHVNKGQHENEIGRLVVWIVSLCEYYVVERVHIFTTIQNNKTKRSPAGSVVLLTYD